MAGGNDEIPPALRDCVIDNIRIGKQIGRGANGRILEAKWEGIVVAVKEIHSIFMNEVSDLEFQSFKISFLRECEQSSRLRHPNIVRFLGIYHPAGARVPSLVMERLHCSLNSLLEENPVVLIGTKHTIIKDVALGLRYLHTRNPPIIHRDLSSNNVLFSVLFSKGMEGKIGDLGTARLLDPRTQSRMTQAPGTAVFMPPEALEDVTNIRYGKELDVFSFGCVILHTLSHQWPTPLQAVIVNPETGLATGGRTEVKRCSVYFERIDRSRSGVLISLIESCLNNLPTNRPSIVRVCDQLEDQLVDRKSVSINDSTVSALQQEIQEKDAELQRVYNELLMKDGEVQSKTNEIQRKDVELQRISTENQQLTTALRDKDFALETLRSDMSKLIQIATPTLPSKQVNKSSSVFWNNLKLTWQQCANLPRKCWTTSVAELDGKVYAIIVSKGAYLDPLMYNSNNDQWYLLPALPYGRFSLVTVPDWKQLLAIGGLWNNKNGVYEFSNKVFLWDEVNRKWTITYPNMPTARCDCSSISHGSTVIVAGGMICLDPFTITRAVEVLRIKEHGLFTKPHWSVVEQLPHGVRDAIPLIVNDIVYFAIGSNTITGENTCNVVTASLSELLQSSNKNTSSGQVWKKLPDMPYPSFSINHYQGCLITFGGCHKVEQPDKDKPVGQSVPLIHIYNPDTRIWDCVGEIPHGYLLGKSVYIRKNELLFMGGLTGTFNSSKDDDIITVCSLLKLST